MNNKFQEVFQSLLTRLSEREQEVLKNRYQLLNALEKKITLRQIGENYNITRERVRQIEREALKKIVDLAKTNEFNQLLSEFEQEYVSFVEKKGGLVKEDDLLEEYVNQMYQFDYLHNNAFLFALEHFFPSTQKIDNHDSFHVIWVLNDFNLDSAHNLLNELEQIFNTENKLYNHQEMINLAKTKLTDDLAEIIANYAEKHDLCDEDLIESYLKASSKIKKNILDQWGLVDWQVVKPKKLSDKIHLIFKQAQKPIHFKEIAEMINQAGFDDKNICPATIHNELIANNDFVLIGRGLYALKDWGYATGTVAEIISEILRKSDSALTKEEIYDQVLAQRQVNKSTIYLTLINKNKFSKTSEGKFQLIQ